MDFSSILQTPMSKIEEPKPLPVGGYNCLIKGMKFDKLATKQTPYVEIALVPSEALANVDTNQLAEVGDITKRALRTTFYLTEDAIHILKKFLKDHVKLDEGLTLEQGLNAAVGQRVGVEVEHAVAKNGSTYAEVKRTFEAQ